MTKVKHSWTHGLSVNLWLQKCNAAAFLSKKVALLYAHNRLPFLKHLSAALLTYLGVIFLTDNNNPHVSSMESTRKLALPPRDNMNRRRKGDYFLFNYIAPNRREKEKSKRISHWDARAGICRSYLCTLTSVNPSSQPIRICIPRILINLTILTEASSRLVHYNLLGVSSYCLRWAKITCTFVHFPMFDRMLHSGFMQYLYLM